MLLDIIIKMAKLKQEKRGKMKKVSFVLLVVSSILASVCYTKIQGDYDVEMQIYSFQDYAFADQKLPDPDQIFHINSFY